MTAAAAVLLSAHVAAFARWRAAVTSWRERQEGPRTPSSARQERRPRASRRYWLPVSKPTTSRLARWNAKVNLTAFSLEGDGTDPAIDRLLIEPLLAVRHLSPKATSLLDAGSGGGSAGDSLEAGAARTWRSTWSRSRSASPCSCARSPGRSTWARPRANARFEELLTRSDLHEAMSAVSIRAVRVDAKLSSRRCRRSCAGGRALEIHVRPNRGHGHRCRP